MYAAPRHDVVPDGTQSASVDREWVVLRNDVRVLIAPLSAGDEAAIVSWFAGLGDDTRRARFLASLKQLDRRTRSELARVDHVDREALTAQAGNGEIVGIARYIRLEKTGSAEVAIAVADMWTGQGIATILLERVAARARAVGIRRLSATCLATNDAIIRQFRRIGNTTVGPAIGGVVDVRIDLTRPAGSA